MCRAHEITAVSSRIWRNFQEMKDLSLRGRFAARGPGPARSASRQLSWQQTLAGAVRLGGRSVARAARVRREAQRRDRSCAQRGRKQGGWIQGKGALVKTRRQHFSTPVGRILFFLSSSRIFTPLKSCVQVFHFIIAPLEVNLVNNFLSKHLLRSRFLWKFVDTFRFSFHLYWIAIKQLVWGRSLPEPQTFHWNMLGLMQIQSTSYLQNV